MLLIILAICFSCLAFNNDLECALCGIAVNEVEGLLNENVVESVIEKEIQNKVCSRLPSVLKTACDLLAKLLPSFAKDLEKYKDLVAVPKYIINLDDPPASRWTKICSQKQFIEPIKRFLKVLTSLFGESNLDAIGKDLNKSFYSKEIAEEISGCEKAAGIEAGLLATFQIAYAATDACTSIVSQTTDGHILHSRNLDFFLGMLLGDILRNLTIEADFQRGGKTEFISTQFVGYVGILSAQRPQAFTLTIDTRFYPGDFSILDLIDEIAVALKEGNATHFIGLTARNAMTDYKDYASAFNYLAQTDLLADVYFILSGINIGEGAVITRNRTSANILTLPHTPGKHYILETNYDHWKSPPLFDDRRAPAKKAMNALQSYTLPNILNKVLSVRPVFNMMTVYSISSNNSAGFYETRQRFCPYPCPE